MKKQSKAFVFYTGIVVFAIGLMLSFVFAESEGIKGSLPSVLTGCGAGIIGAGLASILLKKKLKNNPDKAKEYEIAEKDERNIRLREKAGYATWYTTLFMLAFVSLIFVILDYYLLSLVAIGALFVHIISLFVFICIYDKKL